MRDIFSEIADEICSMTPEELQETLDGQKDSDIVQIFKGPTFAQVAEAWANFKPVVPLSYYVACRNVIRESRV